MKKIGDYIKIINIEPHPITKCDMTGWRGRIVEINDCPAFGRPEFTVAWDGITLQNMGMKYISKCIQEGIDWEKDFFFSENLRRVKERDTPEQREQKLSEIKSKMQKQEN
jgi:hypothetical protein